MSEVPLYPILEFSDLPRECLESACNCAGNTQPRESEMRREVCICRYKNQPGGAQGAEGGCAMFLERGLDSNRTPPPMTLHGRWCRPSVGSYEGGGRGSVSGCA